MDRERNKAQDKDKSEVITVERVAEHAVAAATQTQVKDFSPGQPSPCDTAREAVAQAPDQQCAATSSSSADRKPGFVDVYGDVGGPGHNETEVDIIAVPCPGSDPLRTWTCAYDLDSEYGPPSEAGSRSSTRRKCPWITRDLRGFVSIARVFLYRHRALEDGMTLESLSKDLLDLVEQRREGAQSRPLFFIAHSLGGLVVKLALVQASQSSKYQSIMENCHGVTFFGTPHRGSSYMSMPNLKQSIQELLHLQAALPQSLTDEIRINNIQLIKLHHQFVDMASELRLWSFYETKESLLSGSAAGLSSEVQFGAPLVSIKSALLEIWQEDVYAVESDHAHLGSFGTCNDGVLASYIVDLAAAVRKAAELSRAYIHTPLHLKSHVEVEVIGFYEDPVASSRTHAWQSSGSDTGSIIRLYNKKTPFSDFLKKGPERCLLEKFHRAHRQGSGKPRGSRRKEGESSVGGPAEGGRGLSPANSTTDSSQSTTMVRSPDIVITTPPERPRLLGVPVQSEPTFRPPSPESCASVSTTVSGSALPCSSDLVGEDLAKKQAEILIREHELTITSGFSRPDPSWRKFVWIHLPFNNPVWVKDIFTTLGRIQGRDFSRLFDYDNWVSKQIQNRNSDSQPAYLKTMCKYLSASDRVTTPRIPSSWFGPASPGIMPNCLYLYLPYLHFDTYRSMVRRRKLIHMRRRHGRAKPVPERVAQEDSLELKVIWEYIGFDPPLNCRRTLDQFGNPSLRDTDSRDDDQMLYKLTKKDSALPWGKASHSTCASRRSFLPTGRSTSISNDSSERGFDLGLECELKNGHVLMVDQLWLWSIDMTNLTTFFPKRESSPTEGTLFQQADLRNSVYNELSGDLTGRTENALDLAALIVWHAVTVLLDRSSHPDLEIFRIFDEAIGMLAERMTLNMKQFRMQALNLESDDDGDDSDHSDAEGQSPAAIKRRYRREIEKSERENRENTSALLELRDLEDELSTLQKLFDMQESTIHQMKDIYTSRELRDITGNGQDYLDAALEYLEEYKEQTAEMLKRVDTTRNDYEKMLEMVQRQAQVDEVRWSRLQAELASSQNLSVIIFTTFTVIFLPLTFFTGLFGMNTVEWQEHVPSLKEIGAISLPTSVLLVVLSLVAAFSWRVQSCIKAVYTGVKGSWKTAKRLYSERWEPTSRKEAKKRRREEKKRRMREAQMRGHNDQAYDFWAMVKKQQTSVRYQIPDQNVNSAIAGAVSVGRKLA
ncbi:hypothetical protein VTK56DRAFT_7354 [Thermocarpiscus australiensis]